KRGICATPSADSRSGWRACPSGSRSLRWFHAITPPRRSYNSLLTRFGEAQVAESMEIDRGGERFRILEPAEAPTDPSAPNRVRLLMMGFILALVAAFVAVLAVEQFDTSFHSVDELRGFTSIPVLASIPHIHP